MFILTVLCYKMQSVPVKVKVLGFREIV